MILSFILCIVLAKDVLPQYTPRQESFMQLWSKPQTNHEQNKVRFGTRNKNNVTPLNLVLLPSSFKTQRCLDGSPFGYYIRRSKSQVNSQKWIIFLMAGGACVTPIDCGQRKNTFRGSSKFWNSTFIPGTDFPGINAMHDILSDNPEDNPEFFDYNHVYLQYCSGDLWTGT